MPNLEDLSIDIDSYWNVELTNGCNIRSLVANLPLRDFRYFLRLQDSSLLNDDEILSTWKDFDQKFAYATTGTDDDKRLVLFSSPCHFDDLMLPCSIAKSKVFYDSYAPHVKSLYLYMVPNHISELFPILQKCHRLRRLSLQVHRGLASSERFFFTSLAGIQLVYL